MRPILIVRADKVQQGDFILGWQADRGPVRHSVLRNTRNGNDTTRRKIAFLGHGEPMLAENFALLLVVRDA